jgi:hypothetical protein
MLSWQMLNPSAHAAATSERRTANCKLPVDNGVCGCVLQEAFLPLGMTAPSKF